MEKSVSHNRQYSQGERKNLLNPAFFAGLTWRQADKR